MWFELAITSAGNAGGVWGCDILSNFQRARVAIGDGNHFVSAWLFPLAF
jgi:hypothetical protein